MGFYHRRRRQLASAHVAIPHGRLPVLWAERGGTSFDKRAAPFGELSVAAAAPAPDDGGALAQRAGGGLVRAASVAGAIGGLGRGAQGRAVRLFWDARRRGVRPLHGDGEKSGFKVQSFLRGRAALFHPRADGQADVGHAAVRSPVAGLLAVAAPGAGFQLGLAAEKIPFFILASVSSAVTFLVQKRAGAEASLAVYPLLERLGNIPLAYAGYLSKEFWPVGLASFYPHEPLRAAAVFGAVAGLAGLTFLAVWRRRSQPYLAVGWFWFLGMLVPTIGVVQAGAQLMADRYSYLPSVGLWIMVAWGMRDLAARPLLRPSMIGAGAAAVAICAVLTSRHAEIYRDSRTLWEATLRVHPESLIAHNSLGKWFIDKGQWNEAREQCREVLALRRDDPEAELNLAEICLREGKGAEAVEHCLKSIAAQPRSGDSYDALGRACLKMGRMDQAIEAFEKALEINADIPDAWCNMGFALLQERRLPEAARAYERALALEPDYALAHNDLGGILRQMGRTGEAMEHFRRATVLAPDFGEAHYNVADILLEQGRTNEALAEYQKALALLPNLAPAQSRVAEILRRQGGGDAR